MCDVRVIKPGYTAVNKSFFIPALTPLQSWSQLSGLRTHAGGDDERNGPRVWCLWFPVAISGYWGQLSVNIINIITPNMMITTGYDEEKEETWSKQFIRQVKCSITISPCSEISDEVISLLLAPGPVYSRHVRHVSGRISQYQGISPSHLPSPSLTNCLDFVRWRWRCGQRLASYYSCIVSIVSITNHSSQFLQSSLFNVSLVRPTFYFVLPTNWTCVFSIEQRWIL